MSCARFLITSRSCCRRRFPLSRLSLYGIRRELMTQGLVAEISGATLWRWFSADALRPWRHRSWIFPQDPDFAAKAGGILDRYDRIWQGRALNAREFVISADEKSSIQARRRKQPTLAPASGRSTRVEHEYFREGAWTYLAAWDVHRAKVFGRGEKKTGIAPVDRLIREVMSQQPYKSARRVFWIMDRTGSWHVNSPFNLSKFRWGARLSRILGWAWFGSWATYMALCPRDWRRILE